ncbi:reverse transcriptase domain-containing protein, partial [Enterobacter cloacae complex sp. 2DZ2F20B]|uniref:reverse transcriptase domain-containing protein n=1 Tax=Enterobacter cloacae complex sp. 2DZ2F20B TaxID=2511993 RepID=UPI0013ECEDC5
MCLVLKSGDVSKIENYGSISLLSNFAKIFEAIIFKQLYSQVAAVISERQHGFMHGRSTVTNLFCTTQFISNAIGSGLQTDVIYLDFSKAFDRLDHGILFHKLDVLGFGPQLIRFFMSYLYNRQQYVHCFGYNSRYINVSSGVP